MYNLLMKFWNLPGISVEITSFQVGFEVIWKFQFFSNSFLSNCHTNCLFFVIL